MFCGSSFCVPLGPAAQSSSRRRDTAPPDLIVITSWTGAAAKHVAKYTSAYNALYPGVPILLITTAVSDLVLRSTKQKLKALAPAVAYLLSEEPAAGAPYPARTASSSSPPFSPRFSSLLLHAFSEGGAHKAVLLARAHLSTATAAAEVAAAAAAAAAGAPPRNNNNKKQRKKKKKKKKKNHSRKLPVHALILDSTPGTSANDHRQQQRHHDHDHDLIAETRRALNNPALWDLHRIARAYLFGEADEVVWWRDVHRHAKGGGGGPGVGSLVVRFKRTGHCAHAKGAVNGAVYWAAVRRTWE
ncbi:hypothetical protein L209DRAFT_687033, partial [Thermothelomyces heterothallicus CBS 203.75]